MLRIFFLKDDDQEKILKHSDDYVVRKIQDPQSGTDYLEMWGYLSDSVFVTMRSPLDSIRESANLANQFLIYRNVLWRNPCMDFFTKDYKTSVGTGKTFRRYGKSEF